MRIVLLVSLLILSGCATVPQDQRHPADPWESYNRTVFNFNDKLDKAIVKPVAKGYQKITPNVVETGVSNFFSNLLDVGVSFNSLLQGKPGQAASDLMRFVLNSTFGIAGFFDVASTAGLEKHDEDFGQTLATWGVPSGPYFMLPFLGPSTVRDTGALSVDYFTSYPWVFLEDETARYALTSLNFIDTRSRLLHLEEILGSDFFDPYATIRGAWINRREALIADGVVEASSDEEDELIKELEALEADS